MINMAWVKWIVIIVVVLIVGIILGYGAGLGTVQTITVTTTVIQTIPTTVTIMETIKIGGGGECVIFKPLKEVFISSEPVVFRVINNCEQSIILPNSAPWKIYDSKMREIFTPVSLQVIIEIKPGEYREWAWDQRDNSGGRVAPDVYYILLETANLGVIKARFLITR